MDDWLKIKHHYAWHPKRLGEGLYAAAVAARERKEVLEIGIPGAFHTPRQLMGEEELCLACYDQPELLHDMIQTLADMTLEAIHQATRELPIDVIMISEDLAGKGGPLWGPHDLREYLMPYYRRVWELAASRGARLFDMDSDGNVNPVLDTLIECGVNCFRTMVPGAGLDIVTSRAKYGDQLAFVGGIDKYALSKGKEAIDCELEYKVPPMRQSGAAVLALDHRIPPDTPLENYRYYVQRMRELLDLE
jgi:uroporphyrinogen-III decarboxylase